MDSHKMEEIREILNPECLEKKAVKIAAFSQSAAATGNSIVVFAMLILQEILEEEALNPTANLASIIAISNSIATLNTSIRLL